MPCASWLMNLGFAAGTAPVTAFQPTADTMLRRAPDTANEALRRAPDAASTRLRRAPEAPDDLLRRW